MRGPRTMRGCCARAVRKSLRGGLAAVLAQFDSFITADSGVCAARFLASQRATQRQPVPFSSS
eukprot:11178162-Lingulodinium_polyedra.AAC.1